MKRTSRFQLQSIFMMLLCLLSSAAANAQDNIVIIDIPYELLAALGQYEELHSLEKQQKQAVDTQMIPILKTILHEYTQQYNNLQQLAEHFEDPTPLLKRLKKMARFIALFKEELTYRQTLLDFQEAVKKQESLIRTP